jgi:DNA replication protein DnaC
MTNPVNEITVYARGLRLPVIAETAEQLADQARAENWTHEEYLASVLARQASAKESNSTVNRTRRARFPRTNTLEEFNYAWQTTAPRQLIDHLATGTFISKTDNIILLGPPGVGKTHLAIGIGIKACQQGHTVMFKTATQWIDQLAAASSEHRLETELKTISKTRLIIIDELGYIPLDPQAANLLFQLVNTRYETGSIIITSNLEFARWGQALADQTIAAAMIDRLVHHAEVITLKGDSYRTRHRREHNKQNNNQPA